MSIETVKQAELDTTLKAKIKKIEDGFKHLFKVSKSIVKKSNEAGNVENTPEQLTKEEESVAQQMSGKMLDYFNKTKSASVKIKKSEIDLGNFGEEQSGDKLKPVEDWLQGVKSKLENSGGNYNREKIFKKVMDDIKAKSPEAYDFYFSENQTSATQEDASMFSNDSEQPKKDPNKELKINENKLFSDIDIANIKFANDGEVSNPNPGSSELYKLYINKKVISYLEEAYTSFLRSSELRSKIKFPASIVNYIKNESQIKSLEGVVNSSVESFAKAIKSRGDEIGKKIYQDLSKMDKSDMAQKAADYLYGQLSSSLSGVAQSVFVQKSAEIKATLKEVSLFFINTINSYASRAFVTKALSEIFKKFSQLTTRITGDYDLEDIVAAMLVGGEKDKFFEQVYSYIVNKLDSDVRTASDVMDKIADEASQDPELMRKYFKAYSEGVECLLTDFVNNSGIPADTVASILKNNYISDETLAKITNGINDFVERGATLEEQRAVKQFIDQYQIAPELAYKLVKTSSKDEFIRMSAAVVLKHTFANVSPEDYKYISEDLDVVNSVAGHINSEIQKLDKSYSISAMEMDKYGTINITIVDEGGNEKQVSNKDEDFDIDLKDESEKPADDESGNDSDLNAEIDKAVKETESGIAGESTDGDSGDIFTSEDASGQDTDMAGSVFDSSAAEEKPTQEQAPVDMGTEDLGSEQTQEQDNKLKSLFV